MQSTRDSLLYLSSMATSDLCLPAHSANQQKRLIVGSQGEWGRMVLELIHVAEERASDSFLFSDMHALEALRGQGCYFIAAEPHGVAGPNATLGLIRGAPDCELLGEYRAAHFSHRALAAAGRDIYDRPAVMAEAIATFRARCLGKSGRVLAALGGS